MNLSEDLEGVELFAAGEYYDRKYTTEKLDEIAEETNKLIKAKKHDPPAKLGHDEEQTFAHESGLPAIGWVTKVYRKGSKLFGDFTKVPTIVVEAIKKGLYKKVSCEIYQEKASKREFGVEKLVLRAVAFLGADVPKVKGLQPFLLSEVAPEELHMIFGEKLMVPANRHPYGALVKMKDGSKKLVRGIYPDGTYDVGDMGDPSYNPEKYTRMVAHDDLELMQEEEQPRSDGPLASGSADEKTKEEETRMADEKEKDAVRLAEEKASNAIAQAESEKVKRVALENEVREGKIAAFAEKHKTVLTPALLPKFKALAILSQETAVKFGEKEVRYLDGLIEFLGELMDAKVVKLGEVSPPEPKAGADKDAVALAEAQFQVHKKESRSPESISIGGGDLVVQAEKYAEENSVSFKDALLAVAKLEKKGVA